MSAEHTGSRCPPGQAQGQHRPRQAVTTCTSTYPHLQNPTPPCTHPEVHIYTPRPHHTDILRKSTFRMGTPEDLHLKERTHTLQGAFSSLHVHASYTYTLDGFGLHAHAQVTTPSTVHVYIHVCDTTSSTGHYSHISPQRCIFSTDTNHRCPQNCLFLQARRPAIYIHYRELNPVCTLLMCIYLQQTTSAHTHPDTPSLNHPHLPAALLRTHPLFAGHVCMCPPYIHTSWAYPQTSMSATSSQKPLLPPAYLQVRL